MQGRGALVLGGSFLVLCAWVDPVAWALGL